MNCKQVIKTTAILFTRRLLPTVMLCIFLLSIGCSSAIAQKGLAIEKILNDRKYINNSNSVVVIIKGDKLKKYNLSFFHSVTVSNWPGEIRRMENAVLEDGKRADHSETVSNKNNTVACYYQLPATKETKGRNRFILFHRKNTEAVLIYLEGKTELEKLIKTFINK